MARLSPQVLVQLARRTVQQEHKWKHTAEHAPPIPDGAVTDDPLAALAPLDVRWLEQLGFPATNRRGYGLPWAVGARLHVQAAATAESHPRGEQVIPSKRPQLKHGSSTRAGNSVEVPAR